MAWRIDGTGVPADAQLARGRAYLRQLRRSLLRLDRLSSALIEPHALTSRQMLALMRIRDEEGLTQAQLTTELDSDQNTVSALMRRLAGRGLVVRRRHPTDRRAVHLQVTDEGAALVAETLPDVDRLSLRLAALMPPEHEAAIMDWLEAVAQLADLD